MFDKEKYKHKMNHDKNRILSTGSWLLLAFLIGNITGFVGGSFGYLFEKVTSFRLANSYMLYFLPIGAVIIVFFYRLILKEKDPGTNLVISAIRSNDRIPLRMTPLIYFSTLLTHLVGGSAGREGAALQMGGSIGNSIGRFFHIEKQEDKNVLIMCGMSGAFSALFGTPIAATIFSMEVVSVGIMHYAALLPCAVSSLIARGIALSIFGISAPEYTITSIPTFSIRTGVIISIFAILVGLLSILFCITLHKTNEFFQTKLKNVYVRAFIGGSILLVLTLLVGSQDYNGAGTDMITACINGEITSVAFLLKIIFTAITLACGYKGGEIIPTFFIGAAFGSLFGNLIGFSPSLCAAVGMGALFCGATNCPITSLLICFELFGFEGTPYFLLAIGFSYVISGYYSLYSSQRIVYSKYKSNYIDKEAE